MIAPRYQDTRSKDIPEAETKDGKVLVRVIAGESLGKKAVIDTRTPIMYLDIHIKEKGSVFEQEVPADFNGFAYVYRGKVGFISNDGNDRVEATEGQLLQLGKGDYLKMEGAGEVVAGASGKLLLIAGVPLNDPIARYGPFVMNTNQEIQQAFRDYQSGKMGQIDGAEEMHKKTQQALKKSNGPKDL